MSSRTEIANLALSHLGIGKDISDLETDSSSEGKACRRFFDTAVNGVLRDFAWPFATKIQAAELVEEDPNSEWSFSYRYPSDCVSLRRVLSGARQDSMQSRAPYKMSSDAQGILFFSDIEDAEIEYTYRDLVEAHYPEDFVIALSYRLAMFICPRITGGDALQIGARMDQAYRGEISRAQANSRNEEKLDPPLESEFIRARGIESDDQSVRFIPN